MKPLQPSTPRASVPPSSFGTLERTTLPVEKKIAMPTPIPTSVAPTYVTAPSVLPKIPTSDYLKKYYQAADESAQVSKFIKTTITKADQSFAIQLGQLFKNEVFKEEMGLNRNLKCECKVTKQHCKLLSHDDIHSLFMDTFPDGDAKCPSCGIELTMWDDKREKQLISSFKICTFEINKCKTVSSIFSNPKKTRIFCNGCFAFAEACYFDQAIMNYYRKIVFRETGEFSISPGYYFPRIESIDEENRTIVISPDKRFGTKAELTKHYPKQEGFVTYSLPIDIEKELIKDSARKEYIEKYSNPNEDTYFSKYYGAPGTDDDIKLPTRVVRINPNLKDDEPAPSKKRKLTESKKSKVAANNTLSESDYFKNQSKYVVFKIPIDPRKTMKKKSLSGLTLTTVDKTDNLEPGNCLLTTRLLAALENRFDYNEFIRWGLDHFHIVNPLFLPRKASSDDPSNLKKLNEAELKVLSEIKKASILSNKIASEISERKKEVKKFEVFKNAHVLNMRSKLISILESNDSVDALTNQDLVATMSERKVDRVNIKKEYMISKLPRLVAKVGLASKEFNEQEIEEKCAQIVEDLFDAAKNSNKKTTFSIKYVDPVEVEKKKAQAKERREAKSMETSKNVTVKK